MEVHDINNHLQGIRRSLLLMQQLRSRIAGLCCGHALRSRLLKPPLRSLQFSRHTLPLVLGGLYRRPRLQRSPRTTTLCAVEMSRDWR